MPDDDIYNEHSANASNSVSSDFKFGNSNFKYEIRFIKKSWIVWESAELVSEKLRRSIESINAVCNYPFS